MVIVALVYLAQTLMLLVKIVEASVRIFGGIGFDKSRHVVDSGLLGALGMAGCCGSRKRRRRRHSPLASRTDSENLAGARYHRGGAGSVSSTSVLQTRPNSFALNPTGSRKGSYQSGPPSVLRPEQANSQYREENDDERGFIMGAWQPFANSSGGYSPVNDSFAQSNASVPAKSTGFTKVGGGKAHVDTPYAIAPATAKTFPTLTPQTFVRSNSNNNSNTDPRPETPLPLVSNTAAKQHEYHERAGSLPPGAMAPFHQRTKSQTAIIVDPGQFLSNSISPRLRTEGAVPPSAYPQAYRPPEDSGAGGDDGGDSSDDQIEIPKKKWYQIRKHRPGSRGSTDGRDTTPRKPSVGETDFEGPSSSSSTPGRSFVVIRKPHLSPSRPTPSTSTSVPAAGSSSASGDQS